MKTPVWKLSGILKIIFAVSVLTFTWNSCDKSGEDISGNKPPSTDLTGTWIAQEEIVGDCHGENYPIYQTDIFVISQSGNNLSITLSATGTIFNGTISDNKVNWSGTAPEGDGENEINFSGTVSSDGNTVTGTGTWTWSDSSYTCSGTAEVSAAKVTQSAVNAAGKWSGDWQSSVNDGISGAFTANISQQDATLSGSIDIPEIDMTNAELKGTVIGNVITFGDIEGKITFTGIAGEDTLSASGSYYYPSMNDHGTWQGVKEDTGSGGSLVLIESFEIPGNYLNGGLTFDGTYLWSLAGKDEIYKISTTGGIIDRIDTPGSYPTGLTFDGSYLINGNTGWGTGKIFKLDVSGNSVFKSPGSDQIHGLTFDGTYLWGADNNYSQPKIYKISVNGNVIDSLNSPGSMTKGLAFDGTYLWLASWDSGYNKIYKLDKSGTIITSFDTPGFSVGGLTFDGTFLWYSDNSDNKIHKLDTLGNVISSFNSPGDNPGDLAFDGVNLWNVDEGMEAFDKIYQLNTSGTIISSFDCPGSDGGGLTFDGSNLFHCDRVTGKIYKLNPSGDNYYALPDFEFDFFTSDGTYLWADDMWSEKIKKFDVSGNVVESFDCPFSQIKGLSYDGTFLWIACCSGFAFDKIYKLNTDGNIIATYESSQALPEPFALTTGGGYLWYIGKNMLDASYKIHKLSTN